MRKYNEAELKDGCTYFELLRRPEVKYRDIKYIAEGAWLDLGEECPKDTEYQVEVKVKYSGYIERSIKMIEKHKGL